MENKFIIDLGERCKYHINNKLNILGYPSSYVSNLHHHYCLVIYIK